MRNSKELIAELVGTFTLVFIGAGAAALAGQSGGGIVAVAFAHGIALMTIIYAWGSISGAHVNPAVTFAVALVGRMTWRRAVRYWAAQLVGSALAGLLLRYLLGRTGNLGLTTPASGVSVIQAVILEAILTFFLGVAVFGSAIANRNGHLVGVAIGMVLTMDILMGGSLTGASMNPARSFGPALGMGQFDTLWIYFLGPTLGASLGAVLYEFGFLRNATK